MLWAPDRISGKLSCTRVRACFFLPVLLASASSLCRRPQRSLRCKCRRLEHCSEEARSSSRTTLSCREPVSDANQSRMRTHLLRRRCGSSAAVELRVQPFDRLLARQCSTLPVLPSPSRSLLAYWPFDDPIDMGLGAQSLSLAGVVDAISGTSYVCSDQ